MHHSIDLICCSFIYLPWVGWEQTKVIKTLFVCCSKHAQTYFMLQRFAEFLWLVFAVNSCEERRANTYFTDFHAYFMPSSNLKLTWGANARCAKSLANHICLWVNQPKLNHCQQCNTHIFFSLICYVTSYSHNSCSDHIHVHVHTLYGPQFAWHNSLFTSCKSLWSSCLCLAPPPLTRRRSGDTSLSFQKYWSLLLYYKLNNEFCNITWVEVHPHDCCSMIWLVTYILKNLGLWHQTLLLTSARWGLGTRLLLCYGNE